ncbi:PLP-dependent aminotransferase family protein [Paenibacillus sp. GCM10028914]|uniref:MocR-like pyridoxine biosynthesis transcription factor PdxR n=1 Tax=Paenibacillus sp. GCM10028914 TaxID=3273416 RepID=UPI0036238C0A
MTWIPIDRTAGTPISRQIYNRFRSQILQGELRSGEKLPSTRELASSLHVSRNVIVEAYEQLLAEGYIEGRHGSGTYVADGTYMELTPKEPFIPHHFPSEPKLKTNDLIDFRHGIPALNLFPRKLWGDLAKRICMESPDGAFGYGNPEGRSELRMVLTRYLYKTRGVLCDPDQIIVTTGATQALSMISKLLAKIGSDIIIEDPITHEIHSIFTQPGTTICPVPVDESGIRPDLIREGLNPSFIYITPSHQFPLGGVLPIQRRAQLIQYAAKTGCYIIEDDYDSEFRYEGAPVSSLQGLSPEQVIYIGTFSKILSPALRMGYIILPRNLIEAGRDLKWLTDLHTPSLDQLILARFIDEGHLDRHILKMKKVYKKRRDCLIHSLNDHFADQVKIIGNSTGLHLVAEFSGVNFTPALIDQIETSEVKVYPVHVHAMDKHKYRQQVILGYGNLSEERIAEGVRRLSNTLARNIHQNIEA